MIVSGALEAYRRFFVGNQGRDLTRAEEERFIAVAPDVIASLKGAYRHFGPDRIGDYNVTQAVDFAVGTVHGDAEICPASLRQTLLHLEGLDDPLPDSGPVARTRHLRSRIAGIAGAIWFAFEKGGNVLILVLGVAALFVAWWNGGADALLAKANLDSLCSAPGCGQ